MTAKEFKQNTLLMMEAKELIRKGMVEDDVFRDITSDATISRGAMALGKFKAQADGVISGLPIMELMFNEFGDINFEYLKQDGDTVKNGEIIATATGPKKLLLAGERTGLDILVYLSSIATTTKEFVDAISGTSAKILHTRKTLPGFRSLAINAVKDGGGYEHRNSLGHYYLVKDNHVEACGSVTEAIKAVEKHNRQGLFTVVEVENMDQFREALALRPSCIMLDDMSLEDTKAAVTLAKDQTLIEVSGNVNAERIEEIAKTGVHRISIGTRLTLIPEIVMPFNFKTKTI